ncbi:quinoprotein dehydrogenase-associated SoxYZ-like carrier [Rivibacter subsaxonicus]|uniref:Sulfur-oxidizing protein SoxY n=1 Tax=Rivibacter subsaxonicus TaxID=457575 RepID=A0A4V2FUJ0_9BURK|nr:quinoprotein dehydrogenase-associated SoxYZ-like carrier [Rivibacter subsaxonicus]RZU02226.1 sulfur-oxidizing protein SoxY [Rivibacter subsaxonicus]
MHKPDSRSLSRRTFGSLAGAVALMSSAPVLAQLKSGDNPEASERWQQVRKSLFAGRQIKTPADGVIALEAPLRAEDAAIVPIAIRSAFAQSPQRSIRKVWLIIDNNPSPVSAVFSYTLASGKADIETRVRIDEYTHVRAIAETDDGQLWMSTRWVKASGGCSAPPGKDPAAARATLGQMRLRADTSGGAAQPALAQLMISHPNDSGMVMDQFTRQFTPPHFVRRVDVSYAGEPVLSADLDFSISENPNLRFWFVPREAGGELRAEVVDSNELRFQNSVALRPGSADGPRQSLVQGKP